MGFVVFLATVLLIVLLTTFLVIDNNRKKAIALEKQQQNERIEIVSSRYQKVIQNYSKARIIKPKDSSSLMKISNNFFVMQSKNEENISNYEKIIGQLTDLLEVELSKFELAEDKLLLSKQIYAFTGQLPSAGHQFNNDFYLHQLPSLSQQVITTQYQTLNEEPEESLLETEV